MFTSNWLFEPHEARRYLTSLTEILERAVYEKSKRPPRVTAADGYITIAAAAAECMVSHWTFRDHLQKTGVDLVLGQHGKKFIAAADLPRLREYFNGLGRKRFDPVPDAKSKGRTPGGPFFDKFESLFTVLIAQPETTAAELMRTTGARRQTADRWKNGSRIPSQKYKPALVALFRERFLCRLSDDLLQLAEDHRRRYMKRVMALRRLNSNQIQEE